MEENYEKDMNYMFLIRISGVAICALVVGVTLTIATHGDENGNLARFFLKVLGLSSIVGVGILAFVLSLIAIVEPSAIINIFSN